MSDDRYIVVDGRRWRATDPTIPEGFRQELVNELMAARRAVKDAGDDEAAVGAARARVQDAKVALGERGEAWWDAPSDAGRRERIAATMRALLRARRPTSSICPSDVARTVGGSSWRLLLPVVREVAGAQREDGIVVVTQGSDEVDPLTARGPVRLRRGTAFPD